MAGEKKGPNKTLSKVELARRAKQKADDDYKSIATDIGPILEAVAQYGMVAQDKLSVVQSAIIAMHKTCEGPLLLENMQVVRIDRNIERNYYRYHTLNVALLNAMIGKICEIRSTSFDRLVRLGMVIDFGMLRLPEELRSRDRKLTEEELATMRDHPRLTVEVLKNSGIKDEALFEAIRMHHERYNGSGYPKGLRGNEIVDIARITAVSDTFDAAIAKRQYSKRKSPFDILAELYANPNQALDPAITGKVATAFSQMLVGRHVSLSDNSIGQVLEVDNNNLAYPVVRVVNRRIQTGPDLYPVALSGFMPLFGR